MKEELTQVEYIIAESKLTEAAESWKIYEASVETSLFMAKDKLGGANSIMKFIEWAQKMGEKYRPVLDALIDFMRDMRPLVIVGGKIVLPPKWHALKWLRIGWAAGKLIVKIIKILI